MPKTYSPVLALPRPGTGGDLISEGDDIIRELTDRLDAVVGPPKGSAGGDLGGSYPNPQVVTINGKAVSAVVFDNDSRLSNSRTPSGAAAGDLSGTYPNPSVASVNGRPASSVVFTDDARFSAPPAHGTTHGGINPTDAIPGVIRQVRAVSNANVDINAPGNGYDNVNLGVGFRVLLVNQTDATQNGIWVWNGAAVPLTRPTDFSVGTTILAGQQVYAVGGYAYINRVLTFLTGGTVGTANMVIVSPERTGPQLWNTTLPAAPYIYNGMEAYLSVDQAASYGGPHLWHLRYRSTNADGSANALASKWEPVGRPWGLRKTASNQANVSSTTFTALGGADSLAIPYTGTYHVHAWIAVLASPTVNSEPIAMVGKNGSSVLTMDTVAGGTGSFFSSIAYHSATSVFTANAGDTIAWYGRSFNGDAQGFAERAIEVTPIRLT